MSRTGPFWIVGVFVAGAFAGCLSGGAPTGEEDSAEAKKIGGTPPVTAVFPGNYRFDGDYSFTLVPGSYAFSVDTPLEQGRLVAIPSVMTPGSDPWTVNNPNGMITMGLWLPELAEGEQVPVIVDAGPYYNTGATGADRPQNRLGRFLIENFVPHGYAVAQLSVRGTGHSGGCMDLMGVAEQRDLSAAITWLGTQSWSNGRVAMTGRSYDGSTPWEVAAQGNPHLKTIIPISGLSDFYGLMTYNGTSESRAAGLIHALYFAFPFLGAAGERSPEGVAWGAVCPEAYRGFVTAAASVATGARGPEVNDYYHVRNFQAFAREEWKGSIFMIHGLQDWNVEPHMGAPVADEFEQMGYFVKQLWGQWGHMYPDRTNEHQNANCGLANMRWDYAEIMLHWFDHELKGMDEVDTGPPVQLLDGVRCQWRNEEHYPPRDADWRTLHLASGGQLADEAGAAGSQLLVPNPGGNTGCENFRSFACESIEFSTAPFERDTIISGLPRLHITVTPHSETGDVAAYLYVVNETAERRIAWTQMNILYAAGGDQPQPVTPNTDLLLRMQFEPMDAIVPEGSQLMLRVWQYTYADHINTVPAPVTLKWGTVRSVVELPILERGPEAFFVPPQPAAGTQAAAG